MKLARLALLSLLAVAQRPHAGTSFARALNSAEEALDKGDLAAARAEIERALERDPKSSAAWALKARWAGAANERDTLVHALHRELALRIAQDTDKRELNAVRERLTALDPVAKDLFALREKYGKKLADVAEAFEQDGWNHSAISAHRQILTLDPENESSRAAIERLAAVSDPSLAEHARPADLLDGISDEWIVEHDRNHADWTHRAVLQREHYVTHTDAGNRVLVRAAEAMEQMNAFYRAFFGYGAEGDKRAVPRIELRIFKSSREYQRLGVGPPAKWSSGQFTGDAVEVHVGGAGGFEEMIGTLFHEAAHQFVSLATNAAGWLNEGLASFFEGSRLLANGTVRMNLPANHRLFPLVERMQRGWMESASDGISPEDPEAIPPKAPTFRIVIENDYEWGPAWYAPVWGVVYFLYNFQDPRDGRFVYRESFRDYVNKSGGLTGATAVERFEKAVLANPCSPTPGERTSIKLPKTISELDATWKEWLEKLRDEQSGRLRPQRPWRDWAHYAVRRGEVSDALELFEKGLDASPDDVSLLIAFGDFLVREKRTDRAVQLYRRAAALLERDPSADTELAAAVDRSLRKTDPQASNLRAIREDLAAEAQAIAQRYLDEGLELQTMEVSWRLGVELSIPSLFQLFARAVEREGRSLSLWKLAYNEANLDGWNAAGNFVFKPAGEELLVENGTPSAPLLPVVDRRAASTEAQNLSYRFLTLDEVTTGDFSIEAEVQAIPSLSTFVGLVFGRKTANDFHALVFHPPAAGRKGYVDLASFYGNGRRETWRQVALQGRGSGQESSWVLLRIDVIGRLVEMWLDGKPVASQEFPAPDVLRGGFGLLSGAGRARFRNIRYLSRSPLDPTAGFERAARLKTTPTPAGIVRGGDRENKENWIGLLPPFPKVSRWMQEPRESWQEGFGFPQLLVLWSCAQNDSLPIDADLSELAQRYSEIGLKIVSIAAYGDDAQLAGYLKAHPFPGSLAIDSRQPPPSSGGSFDLFHVDRSRLPRALLFDVDGKVVWQGQPGSPANEALPSASPLETALEDLIQRRRLRELSAWRERWKNEGSLALAAGDFGSVLTAWKEAEPFDRAVFPDVADALAKLERLEQACLAVESTLAAFTEQQREPALDVLRRWAAQIGTPLAQTKEVRALERSANMKSWERALSLLKPALRRVGDGKPADLPESLFQELEALSGRFVQEMRADLIQAKSDPDLLKRILLEAETRPARWLAREYFAW